MLLPFMFLGKNYFEKKLVRAGLNYLNSYVLAEPWDPHPVLSIVTQPSSWYAPMRLLLVANEEFLTIMRVFTTHNISYASMTHLALVEDKNSALRGQGYLLSFSANFQPYAFHIIGSYASFQNQFMEANVDVFVQIIQSKQ